MLTGNMNTQLCKTEDQLAKLREAITNEIADWIHAHGQDPTSALYEVQPPSSISTLAGEAATTVLIAFERGYRMG